MAQKGVLKEGEKNIVELRGIKIDLTNLSKIQSPVLRKTIMRIFSSRPYAGYREYNDSRHSEYSDHSAYREHYEDWGDRHSEYRDWGLYPDNYHEEA